MLKWYFCGALAAIAVGWLAAVLNLAGYAPVVILPLAIGLVLGWILARLGVRFHGTCRKRLAVGALVLAILAVVVEHAWLYRDFRRQWHRARAESPHVAMFRPEQPWSPSEYFARELEQGRAILWVVDALLVASATVGTVMVMRRLGRHDSLPV